MKKRINNFLGVIGGLGPLASSYFYELLIEKTDVQKDQDHINAIILNHASVPDRTAFILGESTVDPYQELESDVKMLEELGAKAILITCNTAHFFYDRLSSITSVPIFNMIEDTCIELKKRNIRVAALLATKGTLKSNLYQEYLEKHGLECITPDEEIQDKIMDIIYHYIKAGKAVDRNLFNEVIGSFGEIDTFILGCTELSLLKREFSLDEIFVDPLEVEVKKTIEFFGRKEK